jgi:diguanylate cyclase (GGDEF)-like protein
MDELELRQMASRDSLTGVLSRRAFKEEAQRMVALALRHHQALSCIAIDLDHFKSINDTYGHAAGDIVLARVAKACASEIRETDLLGRLGGEEFAVIMPQTGSESALEIAERLRVAIEGLLPEFGAGAVAITASFGIAALDPTTRDLDTLLQHADAAMYEAKRAGRNCCGVSRAPTAASPPRRRVLKGGQIRFNAGNSILDCTVRGLSEDGVGLDVSSTVGIPKIFDFSIQADGFARRCSILSQSERHIEAEFC